MEQKEIILFLAVFSTVIAIFITAIFIFITAYRKRMVLQQQEKHNMQTSHQKELLSTQLEIQQQTMQHIGRELHDNIGQKLTLASLYTQQLAYENKAPGIKDNIENISAIINESLSELRGLSKSLTHDRPESYPLNGLLQQECDKVNASKKCKAEYIGIQTSLNLSPEAKNILLRICQEFIQNSLKHAQCQNIKVSLETAGPVLRLLLSDDGSGFDTSLQTEKKGIGLANMKKRADIIGAVYHLQSSGQGTSLSIEIPLEP